MQIEAKETKDRKKLIKHIRDSVNHLSHLFFLEVRITRIAPVIVYVLSYFLRVARPCTEVCSGFQ